MDFFFYFSISVYTYDKQASCGVWLVQIGDPQLEVDLQLKDIVSTWQRKNILFKEASLKKEGI